MDRRFITLAVVCAVALVAQSASATDSYYSDISAESASKQYKVEAKSPENRPGNGIVAFQSNFVFTCTDIRTAGILWTRKQAAKTEGSPFQLFVSNTGQTAIWTGWHQIVCVDRKGNDRGIIDLLDDAFSKAERENYVQPTTAGPMWAGYSLWYFLEVDAKELFVVRPWWGRRVVIDVGSATLVQESQSVSRAIAAYEREFVLAELAKGVRTRAEWEADNYKAVWPVLDAAFLAGTLQITDAIPHLEKLQDSTYLGGSTSRLNAHERFDGEVDPQSYSTFSLRKVVHLSLRRLGKTPGYWPCHEFQTRYSDQSRNVNYKPKAIASPRHLRISSVRKGMKAEEVLDLIGAPDFIDSGTWEYDMDSDPAFTLILKWDARRVTGIERRSPAVWKRGLARDQQIAG